VKKPKSADSKPVLICPKIVGFFQLVAFVRFSSVRSHAQIVKVRAP